MSDTKRSPAMMSEERLRELENGMAAASQREFLSLIGQIRALRVPLDAMTEARNRYQVALEDMRDWATASCGDDCREFARAALEGSR